MSKEFNFEQVDNDDETLWNNPNHPQGEWPPFDTLYAKFNQYIHSTFLHNMKETYNQKFSGFDTMYQKMCVVFFSPQMGVGPATREVVKRMMKPFLIHRYQLERKQTYFITQVLPSLFTEVSASELWTYLLDLDIQQGKEHKADPNPNKEPFESRQSYVWMHMNNTLTLLLDVIRFNPIEAMTHLTPKERMEIFAIKENADIVDMYRNYGKKPSNSVKSVPASKSATIPSVIATETNTATAATAPAVATSTTGTTSMSAPVVNVSPGTLPKPDSKTQSKAFAQALAVKSLESTLLQKPVQHQVQNPVHHQVQNPVQNPVQKPVNKGILPPSQAHPQSQPQSQSQAQTQTQTPKSIKPTPRPNPQNKANLTRSQYDQDEGEDEDDDSENNSDNSAENSEDDGDAGAGFSKVMSGLLASEGVRDLFTMSGMESGANGANGPTDPSKLSAEELKSYNDAQQDKVKGIMSKLAGGLVDMTERVGKKKSGAAATSTVERDQKIGRFEHVLSRITGMKASIHENPDHLVEDAQNEELEKQVLADEETRQKCDITSHFHEELLNFVWSLFETRAKMGMERFKAGDAAYKYYAVLYNMCVEFFDDLDKNPTTNVYLDELIRIHSCKELRKLFNKKDPILAMGICTEKANLVQETTTRVDPKTNQSVTTYTNKYFKLLWMTSPKIAKLLVDIRVDRLYTSFLKYPKYLKLMWTKVATIMHFVAILSNFKDGSSMATMRPVLLGVMGMNQITPDRQSDPQYISRVLEGVISKFGTKRNIEAMHATTDNMMRSGDVDRPLKMFSQLVPPELAESLGLNDSDDDDENDKTKDGKTTQDSKDNKTAATGKTKETGFNLGKLDKLKNMFGTVLFNDKTKKSSGDSKDTPPPSQQLNDIFNMIMPKKTTTVNNGVKDSKSSASAVSGRASVTSGGASVASGGASVVSGVVKPNAVVAKPNAIAQGVAKPNVVAQPSVAKPNAVVQASVSKPNTSALSVQGSKPSSVQGLKPSVVQTLPSSTAPKTKSKTIVAKPSNDNDSQDDTGNDAETYTHVSESVVPIRRKPSTKNKSAKSIQVSAAQLVSDDDNDDSGQDDAVAEAVPVTAAKPKKSIVSTVVPKSVKSQPKPKPKSQPQPVEDDHSGSDDDAEHITKNPKKSTPVKAVKPTKPNKLAVTAPKKAASKAKTGK